jgi:hypothetical protein
MEEEEDDKCKRGNRMIQEENKQHKKTAKHKEDSGRQKYSSKRLTCLPRSEHNHQPSMPPVFCSSTVRVSPFLNASSSGDSAILSYRARATQF